MRQSDVRTPQCRELASFYDAARLVPATCIVVAGMAAQASFLVLSPVPFTVSVFHRTACYLPTWNALLSGTVAAILLARLYTLKADDALRYVQLFHDTRQQARASYRALSPATQ